MAFFLIKVHNSGVYKTWIPSGGGGYCHTYSLLWDGVYKSESLGLKA